MLIKTRSNGTRGTPWRRPANSATPASFLRIRGLDQKQRKPQQLSIPRPCSELYDFVGRSRLCLEFSRTKPLVVSAFPVYASTYTRTHTHKLIYVHTVAQRRASIWHCGVRMQRRTTHSQCWLLCEHTMRPRCNSQPHLARADCVRAGLTVFVAPWILIRANMVRENGYAIINQFSGDTCALGAELEKTIVAQRGNARNDWDRCKNIKFEGDL